MGVGVLSRLSAVEVREPLLCCYCCCRHGDRLPPVFLPLREVSLRELTLMAACPAWGIAVAEPAAAAADGGGGGRSGGGAAAKQNINSLAAAFVASMELQNPGG